MTLSPSESYARVKANGKFPKTRKFAEGFPFELDEFQINACHALESGKGVLVAAPTGAGSAPSGRRLADAGARPRRNDQGYFAAERPDRARRPRR
ncbi:MAG: hypothetical protein RL725_446, partial [Actinomycetota bacterium]